MKSDCFSSDFSISSIEHVKKINTNTILLDMSNIEDWKQIEDNSFSSVVANLSLHYFDNATTIMILKQIKRILINNGILIARVNTNLDTEFGAGDGIEIEPNFYKNLERGIDKRFFTKDDKKLLYQKLPIGTISSKRKCPSCNKEYIFDQFEVDHIKAWSKGGRTSLDNAQLLCKKCNGEKTNR